MTIAGIAVGATKGYVYIRSEYPHAVAALNAAIAVARGAPAMLGARRAGLGPRLRPRGARRRRRLCLRRGNLAARKPRGPRGIVRAKPPLPAHKGLFGKPTVINNVLSLAAVPFILDKGAKAYADFGMGRSRGTMPIQLAGNIKHGGLFETAFGITLGELVDDIGGGTATRPPGQARCRSAGRSAPISRARCSTRRSTTRPSPRATG